MSKLSPFQSSRRSVPLLVCLLLGAITLALYWPVRHYEFINFDDPNYVYENAAVKRGLSWDGVVWAFSGQHEANWHPLTWLSHMLDCQLYDLNAGQHHWTNVLLHAANGVLLFWLLRILTGAMGRSAFVAGLFLFHPMHVESVAWVSERKDVLSGFFFILTLWAYVKYARSPNAERVPAALWYGLALCFFALGLLAKSMLVTVPCVLLLLDYWPLQRMTPTSWPQLAREKIPFFLLTILTSGIAFFSQKQAGAMAALDAFPLTQRLANLPVSYLHYLEKLFWPHDLSALYLRHDFWPAGTIMAAVSVLLGLSVAVIVGARSRRWLAVGWFWFIGMLVPVSGLVQVGRQAMADRFTYLPSIGLFIAVTWAGCEIFPGRKAPASAKTGGGILPGALGFILLTACVTASSRQLNYWENSGTLMRHALTIDPNNEVVGNNLAVFQYQHGDRAGAWKTFQQALGANPRSVDTLDTMGSILLEDGNIKEALARFRSAHDLQPNHLKSLLFLGDALRRGGNLAEARATLQQALQINPASYQAHYTMGNVLDDSGRPDEAAAQYRQAAEFEPANGLIQAALGASLISSGHRAEAPPHLAKAIQLEPENAKLRYQVARTWLMLGNLEEALNQYRLALRLDPDLLSALKDLAWLLATGPLEDLRNGSEAVLLAEHACQLTDFTNSLYAGLLDAAYAEAGRFPEAITAGEKARELYLAAGKKDLANMTAQRIELYRTGKKFHIGGR